MKQKFDSIDNLLVWLFLFIDKQYNHTELPLYSLRISNNNVAFFTDVELYTCAIFTELLKMPNKKKMVIFTFGDTI